MIEEGQDLRTAVAVKRVNMHRGRVVRGNKEGRQWRQCVFSNQACKVTATLYHFTPHYRHWTPHIVYSVLSAVQCIFQMHTWSQSRTHTSHLLQLLFICLDFSLQCREYLHTCTLFDCT